MTPGIVALIGAIAAPICGLLGTWYGARRAGQAQERQAAARESVHMAQVEKVDAVKQAHDVLVGTIEQMRTELARQDREHAGAITELREKMDALRRLHEQCEEDRERLQERVWELERAQ